LRARERASESDAGRACARMRAAIHCRALLRTTNIEIRHPMYLRHPVDISSYDYVCEREALRANEGGPERVQGERAHARAPTHTHTHTDEREREEMCAFVQIYINTHRHDHNIYVSILCICVHPHTYIHKLWSDCE